MNPLQSIQTLTLAFIREIPALRICAIRVIRVICDPICVIRDLIRDPYLRNLRNPCHL
jgi:hypothetical protein